MNVSPRATNHDCLNFGEGWQYIFCSSHYCICLDAKFVKVFFSQINGLFIKINSINLITPCLETELNGYATASTSYIYGGEAFFQSQFTDRNSSYLFFSYRNLLISFKKFIRNARCVIIPKQ